MFTFFSQVTLVTFTFNLVNPKWIGVMCSTNTNQHVKYDSFVINSCHENGPKPYFTKKNHCALTSDLENPKSIISVINRFQDNDRKPFGLRTDGWTDQALYRPILAKLYALFSLKGVGHNKRCSILCSRNEIALQIEWQHLMTNNILTWKGKTVKQTQKMSLMWDSN